ncbi:hypothetical protein [Adhaeretor mobilis]|uniref:Uncharacterized protein n=1 Tax=Adhaeretor mobilis TaxID=1930276 RepID=A0A517MWY7_9BACT|nr:hypothetical protein [Adhaeretor mobilis]QDS99327.1 hypothetical protein HG15A2_26490 [Adhaeretor mobilis]
MHQLSEQLTEALLENDSRNLAFPNGEADEITATWHHWLAYDELQDAYGWTESELLGLIALEREATGHELEICFQIVVAYVYADCRHEVTELVGADTWLPLLPSGYHPRSSDTPNAA